MHAVTLIGMPGCGKSAVGKIVARRLSWPFLDTDKLIERRCGKTLQRVVEEAGDEAFRRLEEETILELSSDEPVVISTGGSAVYSDQAMRHLKTISTVVFLDAELAAIRAHVDSEAPRGIVGMPEGGLQELYLERLPRYRLYADVTVTVSAENDLEEAASKVLSALQLDTAGH